MHWTYDEAPDQQQLQQGDVLKRTDDLNALLKDVHPYFHSRVDNLYFMVLTQTCDLVRRPTPKTEYIAICPVRPLEVILNRAMSRFVKNSQGLVPVGTQRDQQKFKDFLSRLFNNNESGLFYLDGSAPDLDVDLCAITRLSISVRSREHYDKCLAAKVVQLNESFRAKLGWSVGNIYSRVGTQDWDSAILNQKIDSALERSIVWVNDDRDRKLVIKRLDEAHAAGQEIDQPLIDEIRKVIDKKSELLTLVDRLMVKAGIEEDKSKKVVRWLQSDPSLRSLVKA